MANIWENVISILAGNLNSGRSYLTTTVKIGLMYPQNWVNPVSIRGCKYIHILPERKKNGLINICKLPQNVYKHLEFSYPSGLMIPHWKCRNGYLAKHFKTLPTFWNKIVK